MRELIGIALGAVLLASLFALGDSSARYIVHGPAAEQLVAAYGNDISELKIIGAFSANLTAEDARSLRNAGLVVTPDQILKVSADSTNNIRKQSAGHTLFSRAAQTHNMGLTGNGVVVGVIDTGIDPDLARSIPNFSAFVDVSENRNTISYGPKAWKSAVDDFGHGTHMASVIAGQTVDADGVAHGIAPSASLVAIRAFASDGTATYTDVIQAIEAAVDLRSTIGLDVLSLSFGAPVQSHYWDDPLNRAVMAAWQAGITVVTSAGNAGPTSGSVTVPGNLPYIITVGAASDAGTPEHEGDDFIPDFSASGPTLEGHVKPDLVAPGAGVWGLVDKHSFLGEVAADKHHALALDGTSVAAAATAGAVTLLLEGAPALSPDDVKCRLLITARAASTLSQMSIFQQGAGLLDAQAAALSSAYGCANRGMDIGADLNGTAHFAGPARQAADGSYYIVDDEFTDGVPFDGFNWTGDSQLERDTMSWGNDDPLYAESYPWGGGNNRSFFSLLWSEGSNWDDSMQLELEGSGTVQIDSYPWGGGNTMRLMLQIND